MSVELPPGLRERLDAALRANAFAALLGVELLDWEPGSARATFAPGADAANVHGAVHGGALFALADFAFEVACNGYGRKCVALDVTVHYAAAARPGEALVATASELTRSRRVASYRVEVAGEDGGIRCILLATAYRTSAWHLGETAWPEEWRARF